ncbi:MAG: DNA replication initiation control protein YabA [Atopococcus tabaci]|uniref:Replication initiation control protein YabA n=1 Tax=Atopococcus tabaci TaxID=269774 RepID=A0AA43UCL9_9LACT|nr:DNA replication initiation control protein YabA [Atopococcus tabaci]
MSFENLNQAEIYDQFLRLEKEAEQTLSQIQNLRKQFERVVEENNNLSIENKNLRDRLTDIENQNKSVENERPEMSRSRQNLEKLYEDGFHVCNMFYGSRRVEDEPCAFCLEVIYGDRNRSD